MENSNIFLKDLNLPTEDGLVVSEKRFIDGAQYRIEIPSTEGPKSFRAALDEADALQLPIHRVSQGSGIQMLSDGEIKEMAKIGADRNIEVCPFVMARASFDVGGLWQAPVGKCVQWQNHGANQIRYCLDEINRAVDLGLRSVLLADWGLIHIVGELRRQEKLPKNLIVKTSALMAPANPASVRLLEDIGASTINVATDLTLPQLSVIRQAIDVPMDIYVEAPDGLGGFIRHHEVPAMIRYAAPIYVKLGLRNSADIYPSGMHMETLVLNLSRERVRRSKLVYDLVQREYPDAVISDKPDTEDLGVPEV